MNGLGSLQIDKTPDKKISRPTPLKNGDIGFKKQISGLSDLADNSQTAFSFLQGLNKQESTAL